MTRTGLTLFVFCLSLLEAGCLRPGTDDQPDPATEISTLRKQIRELEARTGSLKDKNAMLSSRVEELSNRERALSARLHRLNFVNEQQKKQLETLRGLPAERDAYKSRVEVLTLEVNRLAGKIIELKRTIRQLQQPIDKPTTQPAAGPAE